jgi:hypothetical protein
MKKALISGLTAILLAGTSINAQAQKRPYIPGNVHEVEYTRTTENDFPKYKLEEQCLFNNCYNFWSYSPKANELNFSVSKVEENINVLESRKITILSKRYTPKKVSNRIDVMNCVTKTSLDRLRKKVKSREYFGFSADITDKDLELKLPEIKVNGKSYIVLEAVEDSENALSKLPIYLIPKEKGTKIIVPNNPFMHGDNEAQAKIVCDEKSGIYQPILNTSNKENTISKPSGQNQNQNEEQEEWQGNTQKTPFMKEAEEREKQEQSKNQGLQKQNETLEKKTIQIPQAQTDTQIDKEKRIQKRQYYLVKQGDTIWNITDRIYGNTKEVGKVQELNPLINLTKLKVGEKIRIK